MEEIICPKPCVSPMHEQPRMSLLANYAAYRQAGLEEPQSLTAHTIQDSQFGFWSVCFACSTVPPLTSCKNTLNLFFNTVNQCHRWRQTAVVSEMSGWPFVITRMQNMFVPPWITQAAMTCWNLGSASRPLSSIWQRHPVTISQPTAGCDIYTIWS